MSKKKITKPPPVKNIKSTGWTDEFRNISIIITGGLILRLIFFFDIKNTPLSTNLFSDSKIFHELALNIVRNNNWFGDILFYMSPGYTYFLSIFYLLFGPDIDIIRILQILINSANIYLIYLIGRELFNRRYGYATAILAAVYQVFIFYSALILSEIIFAFLITLFILRLIKKGSNLNESSWLITGIILGIAALLRGNILVFLPVVFLWMWFTRTKENTVKSVLRPAVFILLGTFLPILPVTINNYLAEKDFVLITSNAGINFFIGNHENAAGIYSIPEGIDLSMDNTGEKYAERMTGKNLKPSEVSEFWFSKGINYIVSNPAEAVLLNLKKIVLFFDDDENPQSSIMDIDFYARNYSFLMKLPLPGFYFIFLFAAVGIALSISKNERFLLIYFLILSFIISTSFFFVIGRFRVGITSILIVFAGYGILKGYELVKEGRFKKLTAPAVLIISFLLVNYFLMPDYKFTDHDAYINLGNTLFEEKQYDRALENYQKALELKEESGTYVLIGNALAVKNDLRGAFNAYKKAIESNPGNPLAHFNLGTLFVRTGDYGKAEEAFGASIKVDSTFAEAYQNIAIIYYMQENYKESLLYFEKYLYLSKDDQTKETVKKDIQEIKKKLRDQVIGED